MTDCCCKRDHSNAQGLEDEHGAVLTDPVCGMKVDTRTSQHEYELAGTSYFFCSARCLNKFKSNPNSYLNPAHNDPAITKPAMAALPEAAQGTVWTCPMHPEIRRDGPGTCPICGMGLEPLEPTLEEGPNPELIDMTRRFWLSAAFSVPLLLLVMGTELFGLELLPMSTAMWVQLALATPVGLWGASPFCERVWASLKTSNLNIFTRLGLGVGVDNI
jgi:Cu+-exporting ATPase